MNRPDPFAVMVGTLIESLVDDITFGIVQPDIVPQQAEELSPIAATIGKTAGSLVGFLPAFGLSMGIAKTGLRAFRSSGKVLGLAEKILAASPLASKVAPPLFGGTIGEFTAGSAIYEVSRQFVKNAKENDPLYHDQAQAAMRGVVGGFFPGLGAEISKFSHPIKQAFSLGVGISLAEAINDASEGIDVKSTDYLPTLATNIVTGAAIGLVNSKGWKERRKANQELNLATHDMMQKMIEGKSIGQILSEFGGAKFGKMPSDMDELSATLDKIIKPTTTTLFKKDGSMSKLGYQRVREVVDGVGWNEENMRTAFKEMGLPSSRKDWKQPDFDNFMGRTAEYVLGEMGVSSNVIGKLKKPSAGASIIGIPDTNLLRMNLNELSGVVNIQLGKRLYDQYSRGGELYANTLQQMWMDAWKGAAPSKTIGVGMPFTKNKRAVLERLQYHIESGDLKGLSPEQRVVIKKYNEVTDMYLNRLNQVNRVLGLPEVTKKDHYMMHAIDIEGSIAAGVKRSAIPEPPEMVGIKRPSPRVFNPTQMERKDVLTLEGKGELRYDPNPINALKRMMRYDMKSFFLSEPEQFFHHQLSAMERTGLIDKLSADYLREVDKYVIRSNPTPLSQKLNGRMEQIIKNADEGTFTKWLDLRMAKLGVDIGDKPVDKLANAISNATGLAFIGARPKQTIRNLLQVNHAITMTGPANYAKAMTGKRDQLCQDLLDKSMVRRAAMSMAEESASTATSLSNQIAYTGMSRSQEKMVDTSMTAAYNQAKSFITEAKYRKLNWWTVEGDELRRKAGKMDVFSDEEVSRMMKHMEFTTGVSDFVYDALGLPIFTRTPVLKAAGKLTSFTFNYAQKFIGELVHRGLKGNPGWAKAGECMLPQTVRYGLLGHMFGMATLAGVAGKLGVDISSTYFGPNLNSDKLLSMNSINTGIIQFRPSPAVQWFGSLAKAISTDDPYEKREAFRNVTRSLPVPFYGAGMDINKEIESGDLQTYLLYGQITPEKRKNIARARTFGHIHAYQEKYGPLNEGGGSRTFQFRNTPRVFGTNR